MKSYFFWVLPHQKKPAEYPAYYMRQFPDRRTAIVAATMAATVCLRWARQGSNL